MLGISKRTHSRSENFVTVLRRQKTAPSADEILWFFLETPDIYGTFDYRVNLVSKKIKKQPTFRLTAFMTRPGIEPGFTA